MATKKPSTLLLSINALHGDTRYADLTVKCGDRRWKVHRAIVCARCKFFDKACDGRFKEAAENAITLVDDPPNAVAAMLRYLYTEDYDDTSEQEGCPPLVFNVNVFTLYDLPELVSLAERKFESCMYAATFNLVELADAIRETYKFDTAPQEPLRKRLMNHVMGAGQHLLQEDAFMQVVKGVPAFAAALVAETFRLGKREELARYTPTDYIKMPKGSGAYRCPRSSCNRVVIMPKLPPYIPQRNGYNNLFSPTWACPYCHGSFNNSTSTGWSAMNI